jgi:hypothetical protein
VIKKSLLIVALLAIGSVLAHLYVKSQVYHPVVHVLFPDGLSIAAVLPETKERKACGAANDGFLQPFRQQCKDCKITMARCERELQGLELALRQGTPLPYPTVVDRQTRVAFMGPIEAAKAQCQATAVHLKSKGSGTAVCLLARSAPGKSEVTLLR